MVDTSSRDISSRDGNSFLHHNDFMNETFDPFSVGNPLKQKKGGTIMPTRQANISFKGSKNNATKKTFSGIDD